MNKNTSGHLSRTAIIYVRQTTMHQVRNNPESQRWQYGMKPRAKQLGWPNVTGD